jgi:hypothetical protein
VFSLFNAANFDWTPLILKGWEMFLYLLAAAATFPWCTPAVIGAMARVIAIVRTTNPLLPRRIGFTFSIRVSSSLYRFLDGMDAIKVHLMLK